MNEIKKKALVTFLIGGLLAWMGVALMIMNLVTGILVLFGGIFIVLFAFFLIITDEL